MILVGGGGNAIHWGGAPPKGQDNAGSPATDGSSRVAQEAEGKASGQSGSAEHTNAAGANRRK
jgi:hypothetical protein